MASEGNDILYPSVIIFPSMTTAVRDTLLADVGTIIFNSTTGKLNICKTKGVGAGSWEAITSA
jgi:hypothetical protein